VPPSCNEAHLLKAQDEQYWYLLYDRLQLGWKTTLRPLEEAFNYIDFVLNLTLVEDGVLEHIIKENIK